jgi:hypothetical protein
VVELHIEFLAFTTDALSRYGFGEALHLQSNPDKAREWSATTQAIAEATPFVKQFPWIIDYALKIPLRVLRRVHPVLAGLLAVHHVRCNYAHGRSHIPDFILCDTASATTNLQATALMKLTSVHV